MNPEPDQNPKPGRFIVVSSPSGGGKTTVIRHILKNKKFTYSISATTRTPREDEKNSEAYWFYNRDEFLKRRDRSEFLEWQEVYGELYGTPKKFAEDAILKGLYVILDLDVKGALRFKKAYPEALLIFLLPPSFEILEDRLKNRSSENEDELQSRLAQVQSECDQALNFDYAVVNTDLELTINRIEEIIAEYIKEDQLT